MRSNILWAVIAFDFFIVYKNYAAVIGFDSCNKFYKG